MSIDNVCQERQKKMFEVVEKYAEGEKSKNVKSVEKKCPRNKESQVCFSRERKE